MINTCGSLYFKLFFVFSLVAFFHITEAQERYASNEGDVFFGGYDPVGFFNDEVLKGMPAFAVLYQGRFIYFANEQNKNTFLEDKEKYFPGYGGWCAIAMSDGLFVQPDYTMYKIQDGQLLFFRRKAYFNGLTLWDKNPEDNKMKADLEYDKYFQ